MNFPSKKITLIIVTYRDAYQWAIRQKEGNESDYQDKSNQLSMAPADLETLAISDGDTIRLSNPIGAILVKVKADGDCPPGLGFIPVSSYINKLTEYNPEKAQLPNFKRIETIAEVVNDGREN
jgi:formylmethanofuran dehydrogenase subunit D